MDTTDRDSEGSPVSRYVYPETPEQAVARALLQEAGYAVSLPPCPDCHGYGHPPIDWLAPPREQILTMNEPCPRGCARPMLIL